MRCNSAPKTDVSLTLWDDDMWSKAPTHPDGDRARSFQKSSLSWNNGFPNFHESIFFKGFPTCHRSHLEPGPLEVGWVGKLFGAPQNYIEHTWAENESTCFCFLAGTTIFTIYLHDEDKACCPKKTTTITKSKTFREHPQTTICQRIVTKNSQNPTCLSPKKSHLASKKSHLSFS